MTTDVRRLKALTDCLCFIDLVSSKRSRDRNPTCKIKIFKHDTNHEIKKKTRDKTNRRKRKMMMITIRHSEGTQY